MKTTVKSCSINGCSRDFAARGLCDAHYRRMRKGLKLDVLIKTGKPRNIPVRYCQVTDCHKRHWSLGYCMKHYTRLRNYSDTSFVSREQHGLEHTPEYSVWCAMKARCTKENRLDYERYGGRGIKVCERWANSFTAFLEDVGYRPSPTHSIDRIDNNGHYEPGNIRWSTKTIQSRNRRMFKNNTSGHKGVYWHKAQKRWQAKITVDKKVLHLGSFSKYSDAVNSRKHAEDVYF